MALLIILLAITLTALAADTTPCPYDRQVGEQVALLESGSAPERSGAAQALGFLRAHDAADALVVTLGDATPAVRREVAMSLGWCGGRDHVAPLLAALDDADWSTRQAAWVALTNLTAMEWPFDALADDKARNQQAKTWRQWWRNVPRDRPPNEVLDLLGSDSTDLAAGCPVTASSAYKGSPGVLTGGPSEQPFWQTKNIAFPQHCTVDLGVPQDVGCVVVVQYGKDFRMTDYAIETSLDGTKFESVVRRKALTDVRLVVEFAPRSTRYVRVISHAAERDLYPTTFRSVHIYAAAPSDSSDYDTERSLRALGALGGTGAAQNVARVLKSYTKTAAPTSTQSTLVQAGLRAMARLSGSEAAPTLIAFLDNEYFARYAADALGELDDETAVAPLIGAYPQFARSLELAKPKRAPRDDRPGLSPADRMYETPFAIASALSRLPMQEEASREALRSIAPLLVANLPSDWDGAMLYEPEAHSHVTAHLLERVGLRREAANVALAALGGAQADAPTPFAEELAPLAAREGVHGNAKNQVFYAATWLPTFCRDREDAPALIALLEHENGWARINAAKALMFMGEQRAVEPLARILAASKPEADHGFFGGFMFNTPAKGQDEYNDPSPRWREAYVRALGRLGAAKYVPLLISTLNDERAAVEIRHAAALALDEIGSRQAIEALHRGADHDYHSIRLVAREALWKRGLWQERESDHEQPTALRRRTRVAQDDFDIVFIKGDNTAPNRFQIDQWRQTYSTTDSGPTYRIGYNLYILRRDGSVDQLTEFSDGYVADCEVSPDGRRVIFCRRGGDSDPWWRVFEIGVDGTNQRQLTHGDFHDVQPAYLDDGRIVFASSRIGMRDEYHGYLATGLTIMNGDGSDVHCVGFNLGRDNEPAVLDDGRIVFSRLELFYSRMKTELTVHAVCADGTRDVTLYGPERRDFWKDVTRKSGEKGWGEVAPRHRVLRLTQPQSFGDGRVLCASTGGLVVVGPGRYRETFLPHDKNMAVTSPFPLDADRVLCAASDRTGKPDLGLYMMDARSGEMTLLTNDPEVAEFEPRPIRPRLKVAPALDESVAARQDAYTARLFCGSVFTSQDERVRERAKLVRVVEGQPIVARHRTHTAERDLAWKNHTGTHARVLGTVPLAADGSFSLEVPADRLVHLQALDSDRRVVGNQLIWMYARPGETRSCVGCHENADTTPPARHDRFAAAATVDPIECLPTGGEFSYRAKAWNKGVLPDEAEERVRTVRAVNLLGRQ